MAGIQITGLASGLDWQNIISELMTAARAPETQWKAQQTTEQSQISSLGTLNTDLTSFQDAAEAMSAGTTFSSCTAAVGDPSSGWTATAAAGTNLGQYNFNVSQLATTSITTGAPNVGSAISSSADVSGVTIGTMNVGIPITAGFFTVDGAQVTISTGDSLQDVLNNIGTDTSNAVSASYDPKTDTIKLASTTTPATPIILGAQNDTSNFLSATALYNNAAVNTGTVSSANALGSVALGATIADSGLKLPVTDVDTSGNGTFAINGVSIAFNVNTDTLQNLLQRIDNSSAGVTATFNNANSQFSLTNNSTGAAGISVSESSGGLLAAMGLNSSGTTFTEGKNAEFSINNSSTFTSASNNLDASVDGISGLTVTATSTGPQTVNVATDTSNISSAINNLISAYNTVQTYITSQTQTTTNANGTVSTNPLSGNQDITSMQTDLQNIMFNSVSGMTGGINSLDSIGIGFTGTSPLLSVLDSSQLNSAIQENPAKINQLFTNYPDGLVAQLDKYITNATGPDGVIFTESTDLTSQSNTITTQISTLESQLTQQQAQLTTEFTNMETAESQYQSEITTLNSVLGTSSSSSSSSGSTTASTEASANANASSSSTTAA
jgi:flagellar hook-associated protein 2